MVNTYRKVLENGAKFLDENKIEDYEQNVCELMGKALNLDCRGKEYREMLDKQADKNITAEFEKLIERRAKGEPLQYLIGEWEFYGLPFKVGEGVLIPRQDTETLVDIILKKFKDRDNLSVVDLCSGSGCIAVALEKGLNCKSVTCVEKSEQALKYLEENIKLNGSNAKTLQGDVFDENTLCRVEEADIISCNPPYLTDDDMKALQKEVTFEPAQALYGGEDGLDFYRTVTRLWKDKLKVGGMLIFEIGINQEDDVMLLLVRHGFENVRCKPDLCGVNRCVFGFKKEK